MECLLSISEALGSIKYCQLSKDLFNFSSLSWLCAWFKFVLSAWNAAHTSNYVSLVYQNVIDISVNIKDIKRLSRKKSTLKINIFRSVSYIQLLYIHSREKAFLVLLSMLVSDTTTSMALQSDAPWLWTFSYEPCRKINISTMTKTTSLSLLSTH